MLVDRTRPGSKLTKDQTEEDNYEGSKIMSVQQEWIDALRTGELAWADNELLNSAQTYTDPGKLCVLGYWLAQPAPMPVQLNRRQRIAKWFKSNGLGWSVRIDAKRG